MLMQRIKKLKRLGIFTILLLLILFAGGFYINKIAIGSGIGLLPEGYQIVEANGHQFSIKLDGDDNNIPVILLHGFPETSVMWNRLSKDLNNNGYYTIAPDQRGYSYGARPLETNEYQISHLSDDVIAIADALGIDKFHLIGHDWGCAVGWYIAANHPDKLISFSALSVPHLTAFTKAYKEDPMQYEESNYIRFFQYKKIPEFVLARNKYKLLKSFYTKHGESERASYINLFNQKNALTGAINWYRANYGLFSEGHDIGKISVPSLFIWGNQDIAIMRSGAEWTQEYISGYYKFLELDSGHWLVQESYDQVSEEIFAHLDSFSGQ